MNRVVSPVFMFRWNKIKVQSEHRRSITFVRKSNVFTSSIFSKVVVGSSYWFRVIELRIQRQPTASLIYDTKILTLRNKAIKVKVKIDVGTMRSTCARRRKVRKRWMVRYRDIPASFTGSLHPAMGKITESASHFSNGAPRYSSNRIWMVASRCELPCHAVPMLFYCSTSLAGQREIWTVSAVV